MLPYFDPTDTTPRLLVNREQEQGWLRTRLGDYLRRQEETVPTGRCLAVLGDKGVGKTILVAAVIDEFQGHKDIGGRTLFLRVDCRRSRNRREVLTEVAQQAVRTLHRLHQIDGKKETASLLGNASILRTLCNFNADAELKVVHEHLIQYKSALGLKGDGKLLGSLAVDFGISLERSEKQLRELVGKLRFDESRLCRAFVDLFTDVRNHGLHVVLHLDNIDELRHDGYQQDQVRTGTRQDVDSVLSLRDAPIALVLCMRTYYAGSLPREVKQILPLKQLPSADLQELLWPRLTGEIGPDQEQALRRTLAQPPLGPDVDRLAAMSRTPLSFLTWLQVRLENQKQTLADVLRTYLRMHHANLTENTLERVARLFSRPDEPIAAARLLSACDDNQAIYNQLLDRQVVLPVDFWHPVDFTLDPELDFLFWMQKGQEASAAASRP